jgi:hypothetical protein
MIYLMSYVIKKEILMELTLNGQAVVVRDDQEEDYEIY